MKLIYAVLMILLTFCNNSKSKKKEEKQLKYFDQKKESNNFSKIRIIQGHLKLVINQNYWEGVLFYSHTHSESDTAREEICYDFDSLHLIKTNSKKLTKILINTNDDYFYFPFLYFNKVEDTFHQVNLTKWWVSNDIEDGGKIIIQDVNFDGYKDLLLFNSLSSGSHNRYYDIWLYDNTKRTYILWHKSQNNSLLKINKKTREITFGFVWDRKVSFEVRKVIRDTTTILVKKRNNVTNF